MDPNTINQNQPVAGVAKSKTPMITGFVVALALIAAAIYFWLNAPSPITTEVPVTNTGGIPLDNSQAAAVPKSDEVTALESDLTAGVTVEVDLTDLDTIK